MQNSHKPGPYIAVIYDCDDRHHSYDASNSYECDPDLRRVAHHHLVQVLQLIIHHTNVFSTRLLAHFPQLYPFDCNTWGEYRKHFNWMSEQEWVIAHSMRCGALVKDVLSTDHITQLHWPTNSSISDESTVYCFRIVIMVEKWHKFLPVMVRMCEFGQRYGWADTWSKLILYRLQVAATLYLKANELTSILCFALKVLNKHKKRQKRPQKELFWLIVNRKGTKHGLIEVYCCRGMHDRCRTVCESPLKRPFLALSGCSNWSDGSVSGCGVMWTAFSVFGVRQCKQCSEF